MPPPHPCAITKSAHGKVSLNTTKSKWRISNTAATHDKAEQAYKCHWNRSTLYGTKATGSVDFERPTVIVVMLLKWRAFCRIQWVITYLVWNKLLQFKNKELDPAPNDVNRKAWLTTWVQSVEMLFHKWGLTSPFHMWFSEDSWVWDYSMSLVYYKCSPECIY